MTILSKIKKYAVPTLLFLLVAYAFIKRVLFL